MKTLLLWIFQILFMIQTGASELDNFPENFVVVKRSEAATLTCGPKPTAAVIWKFKGDVLTDSFTTTVDSVSQNLKVRNVGTPMVGEYSCWVGKKKLSSTYLLLEHDEGWMTDFLSCRAKSYDCSFSCTWTRGSDTAVRLGLGDDCAKGEKSCQWVTKSDRRNGEFQFELSHSLLPYAEESTMLEVTAEAIVELSILRGTKRFYLRDIVQPDSPLIVKCQEAEEKLNVTIDPPSTWSTPHTFFRLEHEIEYVLRDDGKTERSSSAVIPKSISKLRVRSRDSLVSSPWSQWTAWKNVRTGKKLCKCKNTAKYCCPELPSGYLDRCVKRRQKKGPKVHS